ncbi:hypothetical protein T01_10361, partial [Trichinella spiralis]
MEQRKCENADDTKQIADDTKQIEDDTKQIEDDTKQIEDHTKQIEDHTKQIEDDTKQIEDHTKQNKRRQSSWDPNSVGLGLGYFERAKLSHNRGPHEAEQEKTKFLGPQFCRSGIGILRKGEVIP